jgi:hypothetical protein
VEVQKGRDHEHPGKNGAAEELCNHIAGDGSLVSTSILEIEACGLTLLTVYCLKQSRKTPHLLETLCPFCTLM